MRLTVIALAVALAPSVSNAQQRGSTSLTHTVVVTVPPRVKVQIAPASSQLQSSESRRTGLAVKVSATRRWALVVGSKKVSASKWVVKKAEASSMVVYRSAESQRLPETGRASDSEPVMLTVVAP
ncbi:MAG TPA: hypothetical protein VJ840_00260 [Gemmatimonadaceae bacterium]|nr:hypothetical protein [Gemmatimonadaceae bacterium]